MGRHESYDEPPQIPLLTGQQKGRVLRKDNIFDALVSAATALAQAIKPPVSSPSKSTSSVPGPAHQLSPSQGQSAQKVPRRFALSQPTNE